MTLALPGASLGSGVGAGGAGGGPPDLPEWSSLLQPKPEMAGALRPRTVPQTPMYCRGPEEVTWGHPQGPPALQLWLLCFHLLPCGALS